MGEVVNLRTQRKRAVRAKAADKATAQRAAHGAPKAERDRAKAEREVRERTLDQHQREEERSR